MVRLLLMTGTFLPSTSVSIIPSRYATLAYSASNLPLPAAGSVSVNLRPLTAII